MNGEPLRTTQLDPRRLAPVINYGLRRLAKSPVFFGVPTKAVEDNRIPRRFAHPCRADSGARSAMECAQSSAALVGAPDSPQATPLQLCHSTLLDLWGMLNYASAKSICCL